MTQESAQPSILKRIQDLGVFSIRGKIILPYLILTLIVAAIGTYVVTSLVVTSLDERLKNQLFEAGRVVSDSIARQELSHIESARAIAFTVGFAESLQSGERERIIALVQPQAVVQGIECLIVIDEQGRSIVHGMRQADNTLEIVEGYDTSQMWMVQALLNIDDPNALPKRSLGINQIDDRYYYFTAVPVGLEGNVVGVVVVGTSLDILLPSFKITSLADVTIYQEDGRAIQSTLTSSDQSDTGLALDTLTIDPAMYQSTVLNPDMVLGNTIQVDGSRSYRQALGPLRVGSDNLGVFGVALPTNFIIEQRASSRNSYLAIFSTVMVGVVVVGYLISRRITSPISHLVHASQAVADGNLQQRTGIVRKDEIGFLAHSFDQMTGRLEDRTRALEETLGRMRAILSSIGDGVLLEDLEKNLIPLNRTAEVLLQEMADNSLLGPLQELSADIPVDESAEAAPWLIERRRFEVGKKVISTHLAPVRTESGEQLGTVLVMRDVTAEAEAERLKDAFIAHVSHELRTPLTAIKGYCELMLAGAVGAISDEQSHFLQTIHHHTDDLVDMINTLLNFTEIEAWGQLKLNRYPTQPAAFIEQITASWHQDMEEKGLSFAVDLSDDLPPIDVDIDRLKWVIVNLIRNAWQYTPEGGSVEVQSYTQDGQIIIDVADTGIGISPEEQEKLFTRFYRVTQATEIRGIGLGLYVSKAIIEEHGGEIRVSSEKDTGSTFSIVLPILEEEEKNES